jgi:hypothetical protein
MSELWRQQQEFDRQWREHLAELWREAERQRERDRQGDLEAQRRHELERQREFEETERRRQGEWQREPDRQGGRQADSGRTDLQLESQQQLERDPQRDKQVSERLEQLQLESDQQREVELRQQAERDREQSDRLRELQQAERDRQRNLAGGRHVDSVPGLYADNSTAEEREWGYRWAEYEKALSSAVQATYGTDGPYARWCYMQEHYQRQGSRSHSAEPVATVRVSAPPFGVSPPIALGEIKKLNEQEITRGLRQLGAREAEDEFLRRISSAETASPALRAHNVGLALYDVDVKGGVAVVYLQVFGPRTGPMRSIIWEGEIGRVPLPQGFLTATQLGNWLEGPARALVSNATAQFFPGKDPSRPGADLVPQPRGVPPLYPPGSPTVRMNLMPPRPARRVLPSRINLRPWRK